MKKKLEDMTHEERLEYYTKMSDRYESLSTIMLVTAICISFLSIAVSIATIIVKNVV